MTYGYSPIYSDELQFEISQVPRYINELAIAIDNMSAKKLIVNNYQLISSINHIASAKVQHFCHSCKILYKKIAICVRKHKWRFCLD